MLCKQRIRILGLIGALAVAAVSASAQEKAAETPKVVVEADGTVQVPEQKVPTSEFLSPEAKTYLTQHLLDMQQPDKLKPVNGVPGFMVQMLQSDRDQFPLDRQDTRIGGVHVYDYTPKSGVKPGNKHRVLINLHGGGFSGCWPGCAELESIPISSLMGIRVVSVDYREGPENKFPAASEDVASVYKELLKTHKPDQIGIYGCSAGGMLTAMSIAWFQKHDLPMPGAIGIYCASAGSFGGDSAYVAFPLGEARMPGAFGRSLKPLGYFSDADMKDPLVTPIESKEVMAKFPPTLLISGTRDFAYSGTLYTDEQLSKLGVPVELHIWEGLFHGFFYNPDVPESRDAFQVMIRFFDKHLAKN